MINAVPALPVFIIRTALTALDALFRFFFHGAFDLSRIEELYAYLYDFVILIP